MKLALSFCKFLCRYLSTNGLSIPPLLLLLLLLPTISGRKEDYSGTKERGGEKGEDHPPALPSPPKPMI